MVPQFFRVTLRLGLLPLLASASDLQTALDQAMAGKSGAAVVVDVASGRVIASHRLDMAGTRRAAPGSALKPIVLAAAKSARTRSWPCERQLRLKGRRLDCTHPVLTYALDASSALAYSCNSWFARLALEFQPADLARALQRETEGWIATAGSAEDLQLQAIGESGIEVTPLGLLGAYRRLALARSRPDLAPVFAGLEGSVEYGNGQLAKAAGVKVAGKTGTSAHAWFAGFAPAASPQIAVVVFLERGRGGADAAPVAGAVFGAWARGSDIQVRMKDGTTQRVALEDYVAGVLAGEAAVFRSEQAFAAMAVTARSFAVRNKGRHQGFDFCDTTHCQVFRPAVVTDRLRNACENTEGELLWYEGSVAATYYHRHCGGTTEDARNVWPEIRAPYLRQLTDTFCLSVGRGEWRSELRKGDLGGAVAILRRTPSGRAAELRVGNKRMDATAFQIAAGRALGWDAVRSNFYEAVDNGDRVTLQGYGSGHGVGLCQTGAEQRGEHGHTYRQILAFYFPGTVLGVNAQGFTWARMAGERVDVYSTRPQADGEAVALADRMLHEAERRSGIAIDSRPRVRIYPSVAAFRDATGEPGSVAASTLGRTIRMQPLGILRSSGKLDAILLHEMLHVAVESRAKPGLPEWFREGLVAYLVDPGAPSRVRSLVDRYGRDAVISWLRTGNAELTPQSPAMPPRR
jgi:stage II sporulation protein D